MIALPCQMFSDRAENIWQGRKHPPQLCERTENQHFGRSLFLVVLLLSPAWLDLIFSVALSPAVDNRSCSWEAYLWHRQGGKERNSQQQQINGFAVVTLEISVFPMRSQWTRVKHVPRVSRDLQWDAPFQAPHTCIRREGRIIFSNLMGWEKWQRGL